MTASHEPSQRQLKVGFLTQYYSPEVGAPQARLSELARHLSRRGHAMTVLTAMPSYPLGRIHAGYGGLYRREVLDGATVLRTFIYPTQRASMCYRLANYLSFVASSAGIGPWFLPRLDYLLVESPPLFLGLSGIWLSRLKRARLIFNVSDLWPQSAVDLGVVAAGSLAHRLSRRLEAFCYRQAWLVTGQSRGILETISAGFPQCRTFHLSNGVDTERFTPERAHADARALLGHPSQVIGLYAGLHGLAQGLDQIVRAAEALRRDQGIRLVLIGDGPEKADLRERAQRAELGNLAFLDSRPSSEIPALVASSDFVLVPLKSDIRGAVPSKIYEAMASARPILLVAASEAADIVRRHDAGIVVAPGDVTGIVEGIKRLATDPVLRQRLGRNGRAAAEVHFDRKLIADRFINLLEHPESPGHSMRETAVRSAQDSSVT